MSYSTEIEKSNSNKFSLVRLEGAKLAIGGLATAQSVSGAYTLYKTTMPLSTIINTVVNHTSETASTNIIQSDVMITAANFNEYYYNFQTGELWFCMLTANYVIAKPVIITFYLFFTSGITRFLPTNVTGGRDVEWQPRMIGEPSFGFSQENNLTGILSISASSFTLANHDLYFDDFLGTDYSFNNRQVKVWSSVNGQFRVEFIGSIRGASIDANECTFDVEDSLTVLDKICYGNALNIYTNYGTFYNNDLSYTVRENDRTRPVTYLFGRLSPYTYDWFPAADEIKIQAPIPEGMVEAINVTYNAAPSTTVNRKWSCGIGPATAATDVRNITSVSTRIIGGYTDTRVTPTMGGVDVRTKYAIGDTVKIGTYFGSIVGVTATTFFIWPENALITNAMTITRLKCPCVIIRNANGDNYLRASRDYTCSIGSQGDLQITFVNNFEAAVGMPTLQPDDDQVFVRFWNDDAFPECSTNVENLLNFCGIETEIVDFKPPQVGGYEWPDPYISFTVPAPQETNYPTFRDLIENLLSSGAAFIYFDDNGAVRYKSFLDPIKPESLIANESGSDHMNELNVNTSGDYAAKFDFYDNYAGVKSVSTSRRSYLDGAEIYPTLNLAIKKLNNTNRLFEHVNCIDTDSYLPNINVFYRALDLLMTSRRVTYSLKAFSPHFGVFLGDDVLVKRTKIQDFMRIIGIEKSEREIGFKLLDLKKFPEL